MTLSANMGFELIDPNAEQHAAQANEVFVDIDAAFSQISIAMPDSNYTLSTSTSPEEWQYGIIRLTGTLTANRNVVTVLNKKEYTVVNDTTGGFSIVFKTAAGAAVAVLAGTTAVVRCDGAGVVGVFTPGSISPAAFGAQSANQLLAGPASGSSANPTFRAAVPKDLPAESHVETITYAATISVDLAGKPNNTIFRCTLTGNVTVNFTGGTDGQKAIVELKQDGTGSRLVTLGADVAYGADIASYIASTSANKTDVLGFVYNGSAAKYRLLAVAKGF